MATGFSRKGQSRVSNQDAWTVDPLHQVYAVADGVGGMLHGQRASHFAIQTLDFYAPQLGLQPQAYRSCFQQISHQIYQMGQKVWGAGAKGCGTTLSAVKIEGQHAMIAHVGDSFVLHVHSQGATVCTQTHTWAEAWRKRLGSRRGISSAHSGIGIAPSAQALTRCLGQYGFLQVDVVRLEVSPGDWLFLGTDGVWEAFTPQELADALRSQESASAAVQSLMQEVNLRHTADDFTFVAVAIAPSTVPAACPT